jgi:hypothetical protein
MEWRECGFSDVLLSSLFPLKFSCFIKICFQVHCIGTVQNATVISTQHSTIQ